MNFSVKEFIALYQKIDACNKSIQDSSNDFIKLNNEFSQMVMSDDSSVSNTTDNVGLSIDSLSRKLSSLLSNLAEELKQYEELTLVNENEVATKVMENNNTLNNVINRLDSIKI